MSRLNVGNNNSFLEPVNTVTLDGNFGSTLSQAIDAINRNFKKLISAPFLKGEHGENVVLREIAITENGNLTDFGKKVCKEIYGIEPAQLDPSVDNTFGGTINYVNSYDSIGQNDKIAFYGYRERNQNTEFEYLSSQQMYIFLDSRINEIESIFSLPDPEAVLRTFVDLSCALTITGKIEIDPDTGVVDYANATYNIVKHHIIPTLYYDLDIKEWCWAINGKQSKISAQGLRGENGDNAKCYVCKGEISSVTSNNSTPYKVNITEILTPNTPVPTDTSILHQGDFAIVWYLDRRDNLGDRLNCAFGNVENTSSGKCIYVGHSNFNSQYLNADLLTILDTMSLRNGMNDIRHTESTPTASISAGACRGLWVPDVYQSGSPSNGNVHLMFSGNTGNKDFHIGLTPYNNTAGTALTTSPAHTNVVENETNQSLLDFHYDQVKKDFITLGRKYKSPNYTYSKSEIESTTQYSSPKISATSQTVPQEDIAQHITVKDTDSATSKEVTLNSKGLYIFGTSAEKGKSVLSNIEEQIISSNLTIGNSSIVISKSSAATSIKCPLNTITNKADFINGTDILINNTNTTISNGALFVGGRKHIPGAFNAYVKHQNNSSIYNYDYLDALKSLIAGTQTIFVSPYRPRYMDFIPVSIGGWLTIYGSKTSNASGAYIFDKSKTLEISNDVNYSHTFLSGKIGWSGVIEHNGNASNISSNAQNKDWIKFDSITQFSSNEYLDSPSSPSSSSASRSNTKFGIFTSMSGLWTKIGNVVDVKGKIFFTGAKYYYDSNQPENNRVSIQGTFPISYNALYDFIVQNNDKIKFPLPIVVKNTNSNGSSYYVSTGNVFDFDSNKSSISYGSPYDLHFISGKTPQTETSLEVPYNNILNGDAKIQFFGTEAHKAIRSGSNSQVSLSTTSLVEELPNIFSCTAYLKLNNNKTDWGFMSIPSPEKLDTGGISRRTNTCAPIRFSNGVYATTDDESKTHNYNLVRPVVNSLWGENSAGAVNQEQVPEQEDLPTMRARYLYAVTTISPYIVRCMNFQFSYLLDDDIYGSTSPYKLSRNSSSVTPPNYDTESWGLTTSANVYAQTNQEVALPAVEFIEANTPEVTESVEPTIVSNTPSWYQIVDTTPNAEAAHFYYISFSVARTDQFDQEDRLVDQEQFTYPYPAYNSNDEIWVVLGYEPKQTQSDYNFIDDECDLTVGVCATEEEANTALATLSETYGTSIVKFQKLNPRQQFQIL